MLRVEVSEVGQDALPVFDVDDREGGVVIGSAASARIRLPAASVLAEHVRIEAGRWRALGEVRVAGQVRTAGEVGDGVVLELGGYHVRVAPAPPGAVAAPVQRTESLARELMRGLLGATGAPSLEVERGPVVGAKRSLAPPESTFVIGRGDEADWCILDGDLSRKHAELRRGWDGVRIVDLGSKNGTIVDGVRAREDGAALRDGALIELGKVVLRYRDPAEQQLGLGPRAEGLGPRASGLGPQTARRQAEAGSAAVFYVALAILVLALAGLVWIVAS